MTFFEGLEPAIALSEPATTLPPRDLIEQGHKIEHDDSAKDLVGEQMRLEVAHVR